jgi:hypothetical protein
MKKKKRNGVRTTRKVNISTMTKRKQKHKTPSMNKLRHHKKNTHLPLFRFEIKNSYSYPLGKYLNYRIELFCLFFFARKCHEKSQPAD